MRIKSHISIIILLILTTCCKEAPFELRYFKDEKEVSKYLTDNIVELEELVNKWVKVNPDGNFTYSKRGNEELTWNDITISQNVGAYTVRSGGKVLVNKADFGQAARVAKVSDEELSWWIKKAQTFNLYSISIIGTKLPPEKRYVQLWLRGSELTPYGLIYVPETSTSAFTILSEEAKSGQLPNTYKKLKHLTNRWFYFEENL